MLQGYKKPLTESVMTDLHPRDKCQTVVPRFLQHWEKAVKSRKKRFDCLLIDIFLCAILLISKIFDKNTWYWNKSKHDYLIIVKWDINTIQIVFFLTTVVNNYKIIATFWLWLYNFFTMHNNVCCMILFLKHSTNVKSVNN